MAACPPPGMMRISIDVDAPEAADPETSPRSNSSELPGDDVADPPADPCSKSQSFQRSFTARMSFQRFRISRSSLSWSIPTPPDRAGSGIRAASASIAFSNGLSQMASRTRWPLRTFIGILIGFALLLFVWTFFSLRRTPDLMCDFSSMAVGLDAGEISMHHFIRNQLLMNVILLVMITPCNGFLIWKSRTPYLKALAMYGFVCYGSTASAIIQYNIQLMGWCSALVLPSLCTAVFIALTYMASMALVFHRMHKLESAMLRNVGFRTAIKVFMGAILLTVLSYYHKVAAGAEQDLPKAEIWFFRCVDYGVISSFWVLAWLGIRPFLQVWRVIRFKRVVDVAKQAKALSECRSQTVAILFSYCTMVVCITVWGVGNGYLWGIAPGSSYRVHVWMSMVPASVDIICNVFSGMLFGGEFRLDNTQIKAKIKANDRRLRKRRLFLQTYVPDEASPWHQAVKELACRGIPLRAVLDFYEGLGTSYMPHYDPLGSTTRDVVWQAIVQLTREGGSPLSTFLVEGKTLPPRVFVSHTWASLFSDLVAAIVADAIGDDTYDFAWHMLHTNVAALRTMLEWKGVMDKAYWVCAFSVNQHRTICGQHQRDVDAVTEEPYPVCGCACTKYAAFSEPCDERGRGVLCEANKFDDMIAYLAAEVRGFKHLVAVDRCMTLFSRAWVLAELAEVDRIGVRQTLIPISATCINAHLCVVQGLRVEAMQATFKEDVEFILAKIPDKDAFNQKLREVIMSKIADWQNQDVHARIRLIGTYARMLRWGCPDCDGTL